MKQELFLTEAMAGFNVHRLQDSIRDVETGLLCEAKNMKHASLSWNALAWVREFLKTVEIIPEELISSLKKKRNIE